MERKKSFYCLCAFVQSSSLDTFAFCKMQYHPWWLLCHQTSENASSAASWAPVERSSWSLPFLCCFQGVHVIRHPSVPFVHTVKRWMWQFLLSFSLYFSYTGLRMLLLGSLMLKFCLHHHKYFLCAWFTCLLLVAEIVLILFPPSYFLFKPVI